MKHETNYDKSPYHLRLITNNKGFTLVELSIVLVVIGLLVSGILVGQDMIRAAELRSITTEKDQIQSAVMLFKNKYLGLPGDLNNATAFWGTMPTGTCNNSGAGASGGTGTQTCNGNGDGIITRDNFDTVGTNYEMILFWQHLSNAGLIQGKYSGIFTDWGNVGEFYFVKSGNSDWFHPNNYSYLYTGGVVPITSTLNFEGDYGNSLVMNRGAGSTCCNVLTPSEAWGIDKKIDDGLPGIGNMVTRERGGVNCNTLAASAATPAASYSYNLSYSGIACELEFRKMW
jgi:prepilin-type N-terminal cleavage/methylation domain-containing protein